MDNLPIILANAHLLVIVIICLTRKPVRMKVEKVSVTAKSRKLTARWTIEEQIDTPTKPL